MALTDDLPVVTIVLFIAIGALVFLMLFLFGKRQIMRFAPISARKPHITIGSDAPKELRDEIMRQLSLVQNVRYEPTMLTETVQQTALTEPNHYYHRMKALDAFTNAIECCRSQDKSITLRSTKQTIQLYLFSLCPSAPSTPVAHIVHQFCCAYNHARHNPAPFADAEFVNYMELLDKVIRLLKKDQNRRTGNLDPPIDTEVRIRKGGGGGGGDSATAETVPHASASKRRKPMTLTVAPRGGARPQQPELISLVDKSSGYSSTDHSSSSKGSAERLISPALSVIHQDEAV